MSDDVLFEDFNGRLPAPRLPLGRNGERRTADGIRFLSAEQAALRFGMTPDETRNYWQFAWDDVLQRDSDTVSEKLPIDVNAIKANRLAMLHSMRYPELSDEQFEFLIATCEARKLSIWAGHVFPKLVHNEYTARPEMRVMATINGLRSLAIADPSYAGCDRPIWEPSEDDSHPSMCTFVVYRMVNGVRQPFAATALWNDCAPPAGENEFWDQRPYEALEFRAEAKSLRRAFAEQLVGIYDPDEMRETPSKRGPAVSRPARRSLPAAVPSPASIPDDPAVEIPTTRIGFELALKELGCSDQNERLHLITLMKSKFAEIFETDESEFWPRAYRELRRNPRMYGVVPGTG